MKIVLRSIITLLSLAFLVTACGDSKEEVATSTVDEPAQQQIVEENVPEAKPVVTYTPTSEIAGTRLEEAGLIMDTSEVADPVNTFTEAEKLVCDDENLPESVVGRKATLYVCPQNDWSDSACITVDVSHCRNTKSFCRCVLGNDIADSDFRRHDTWALKGQNEFTYLLKP